MMCSLIVCFNACGDLFLSTLLQTDLMYHVDWTEKTGYIKYTTLSECNLVELSKKYK